MTTLDEIYAFAPGMQASWHPSTSMFGWQVEDDLAAWRAVVTPPDYNAPVTAAWPVARDFSPLVELVAEARLAAGGWTADTEAALAEQQENVAAFCRPQLDVIFGRDD